ncbi:hypothetical protein G9F72_001335 [Clostridium estertheticum]|uniref:hypothetical protein n=1 Tax=Clostridium estertheticum TaxID=238834 RepID=UPI0013E91DE7|nr:hypothetical protein [Clostridium estertheticum]MBZ9685002.1 hypothetical protein [Clostridium estertheticum]
MIDFRNKPMISKYRKLLNVTHEELGRGIIAEDIIKLLEKGKRKLTIPTASILVIEVLARAEDKSLIYYNLSVAYNNIGDDEKSL